MLETTLRTGRVTQGEGFHLIESYRYLESERVKGRLLGVEVTLSDWFYNSLVAKEVLTINKEYFRLRKPLDRRLYEIARKHCGRNSSWSISVENLRLKSGSTARLNHFRNTIKERTTTNHLPEYSLAFDAQKDMVTFRYSKASNVLDTAQGDLLGSIAPSELSTQIPTTLLEDVRAAVGNGLDYYDLWHQYINWSGAQNARNARAGFIGFCRKKAAKAMRA